MHPRTGICGTPFKESYVNVTAKSTHPKSCTYYACPAREIIITDAISKAEEIMRKIEKNYPPR